MRNKIRQVNSFSVSRKQRQRRLIERLPEPLKDNNFVDDIDHGERDVLVKVVLSILSTIVSKIYPADPKGVQRLVMETAENELIEVVKTVISCTKWNSPERRTLLAAMSMAI